jgi:hypothetical protein
VVVVVIRLCRDRLLDGLRLALPTLLALAVPAAAVKTDVVTLRNGDRMTGEVESLERGRLLFKTDDMGTLEIEWDNVASVAAAAIFEVDDLEGARYYGSLLPPPRDGALSLSGPDGVRNLDLLAVSRIARLGSTFWNRLDGAIDFGTSYTSASELLKFDLAFDTRYDRPGYAVSTSLSATLSRQPDVDDTQRADFSLGFLGRRADRWVYFGEGLLETNRELGFDLRTSVSGGLGRYVVQSRSGDFMAAAGASVNRELPLEGDGTTNSELLVTLEYDRYSYDFPKVDIVVTVTDFESMTETGRRRVEADASVRRELLKDFTMTLRAYESYDSKPATEGSTSNDYGLTFALGWSY